MIRAFGLRILAAYRRSGRTLRSLCAGSDSRRKRERGGRARLEFLELRTFLSAGWDVTLIDSTVGNQAVLRRALVPGGRVILYNGKTDSPAEVLSRVTDWAQATASTIKSISMLSDGAPGRFEMGNQWISNSNLIQTAPDWERLSHVLASDAVIELYGCDLSDPLGLGQRLINRVAGMTGAQVFATTNLVGHSGDWALESAVKQLNPFQNSSLVSAPPAALSENVRWAWRSKAIEVARSSKHRASLAVDAGGTKGTNRTKAQSDEELSAGAVNYPIPRSAVIAAPAVGTIAGWTNRALPVENVVLLDTQVPDPAALEQAVLPGSNLITYDGATQSADQVLAQVIDWAQTHDVRIGSLSILSHGHAGAFELGNQWISSTVLAQTAMEWRRLGGVLASDASVDVFGCDVGAAGSDGQLLIDKISNLTGAAVFASTNLTGKGGDWNLEIGSDGQELSAAASAFPMNAALLKSYPDSLFLTLSTPAAASPNPVTGKSTSLSVAGFSFLTPNPTYSWTTTGTVPAAVTYSVNGTTTSGTTTATFTKAGTYNFTVTITDGVDFPVISSVSVAVDQTATSIAVSPATAALNANQTKQFTATELDQFGNVMSSQPTLTWSMASGVGSVGSGGLYTAPTVAGSASVKAASGSLRGSAAITVATPDEYPTAQTTLENAPLAFSTQNGNALAASSTSDDVGLSVNSGTLTLATTSGLTFINGTSNGSGTVEFTGTAPAMNAALNGLVFTPATNFTGSDPLTFITVVGGSTFTDNSVPITVNPTPPTVASAARANPNPVTGTTTALSVLGADDAGESHLTYTWSTVGTVPAPVSFAPNGNHGAQYTTATFAATGTYDFQVTITDPSGLTVTSDVSVQVQQTATSVVVAPATPTVPANSLQQFTATVLDQFGNAMTPQPGINWTLSGAGTLSNTGLYLAPAAAGSATVTATAGPLSASTNVVIGAPGPTVPDGSQVMVQSNGAGVNPQTPAVAMAANGNFVVAWFNTGNGGEFNARLYDAAGSPIGSQILVNTTGTGGPNAPAVAMNAAGAFVVCWDSGPTSLYAQLYNASGSAVGGNILVSSSLHGNSPPTVAMAADGSFTVAYEAQGATTPGANGDNICVQRFSASGVTSGAPIVVDTPSADNQIDPSIGTDPAGNCVVAWVDQNTSNINCVLLPASGAASSSFVAGTASGGPASDQVQVGVDESGNFVIGWATTGPTGAVYTRRYSSTGAARDASPVVVSTTNNGPQTSLALGERSDGSHLLAWIANLGPGNPSDVVAQAVNANGTDDGNAFLANNTATQPNQTTPAVAWQGGEAVIAWNSTGGGSADGVVFQEYSTAGAPDQPPVNTVPASASTIENTPITFSPANGNGISVSDPDSGGGIEQVTLTSNSGTLTLGSTSGITIVSGSASGGGGVAFTGTIPNLNAALNGLVFTPATNNIGSASLQLVTDDLGNNGTGDPLSTTSSIPITILSAYPSVATAASASPSPVTGTTTNLSVLGADAGGEAGLTYSWSVLSKPSGATDPSFSANGTNSAQNTTATFNEAGTYSIEATITNAGGFSTTSSVNVTVDQAVTSIAVSPGTSALNENQTQQLTAIGLDQFGNAMATQPAIAWAVGSGVGSVSSAGLYTAPYGTGSASVTASSGSVSGLATIIVNNAPPTIATAAAANPGTVTGTTTSLSVLGADDGGEANLTYSWSVLSLSAGASDPSFSLNGTNAAQDTTATFSHDGTYVLEATITDAGGLSATSLASVNVDQTFTSIAISPANISLTAGGTQQYSATALDQFGMSMAQQPSFTWGSSDGMIDSTGFYTAPPTSGAATVSATSGSVNGSTTATIVGNNTAEASPSTVTGNSTTLSVSGGATTGVTYTWSTLTEPAGAAAPTFSANASSAAQTTTAAFFAAGDYTFQVAISAGATTTQTVDVAVEQTLSNIEVTPGTSNLNENGKQAFSAVGFDQFDQPMLAQPSISWAVASGGGTIDGGGLYTAAGSGGAGPATIAASSGTIVGGANITVTNAAPTIATPAAASPSPVNGTTTLLSVLGADDGGESHLTYTWSTIGTPPAAVGFSVNGSNAAGDTIATFTQAGDYQFLVTITDVEGLSVTSQANVTVNQTLTSLALIPASPTVVEGASQQFQATATDQFGDTMPTSSLQWSLLSGTGSIDSTGLFTAAATSGATTIAASSGGVSATATITVPNEPPTVATAAAASPNVVTGIYTSLSVLGADDGGESSLTYTWSTIGTPPAPVEFSGNDSNSAKHTIASFSQVGDYQFSVTITDAEGLSVTSNVNVIVDQALTSLAISPGSPTVSEGTSQQFIATATDQFGNAMATPSFLWSVRSGTGFINSDGLYTASTTPGLTTVSASSGGISATATINVPNQPPTVAIVATASPRLVAGTSTALSVLGTDDGGESNLTYMWSVDGTAPAPVEYSVNGSNNAKNTVATFTAAGDYPFVVTITDADGATVTSSVDVLVVPAATNVKVDPANPTVGRGQTAQFSAVVYDQFGKPLATQPTFNWSVLGVAGSIDTSGLYSAPLAGKGTVAVVATAGDLHGGASVTLDDKLSANVPATISTSSGLAVVFWGNNALSISDGDPKTASVPVSITLSATHGTIGLSDTAGLTFVNGTGSNDNVAEFSGTIVDINAALRGMSYTPDTGFGGAGSVTLTINEVGTGRPSLTYPVAIQVAQASVPLSSGVTPTPTPSSGGSSLTGVLDNGGNSDTQTTTSTSNGSGGTAPSNTSPSNSTTDSGSSGSTGTIVHNAPSPAPTPAPAKPSEPTPKANSQPPVQPANAAGAQAAAAPNNQASAVPDARVESVPEQVFPFLAAKSEMSKEMDAADEKLVHDHKLKVVAGSATVASVGASAAYVLWLLRGGSLLSSLLSMLPAWQTIDPLPVLDNFESRKRRKNRMDTDSEGESIESMVDKANSDADQADEDEAGSARPDTAHEHIKANQ